jgi:putative glutamine amidotransferase
MKIGLTYTGSEEKHNNYVKWLKGENEDIEVLKLSADDNNLDALNSCHALVLSGGIDMHPKFYNNPRLVYPNAHEFDVQRDMFEIDAFRFSLDKHTPVFGICRGLQLINCVLGGNMKQDLGELNKTHKGDPDKRHMIKVKPGTLLEKITGSKEGETNSAHHQAIDILGKDLQINCVTEDGTVEGIEFNKPELPFLLAVQWHPERMFNFQLQNTPLSKAIRDRFVEEIRLRVNG